MLRPRLCYAQNCSPRRAHCRCAEQPVPAATKTSGRGWQYRSNTIANADKTIPAATPIIPVTLITRPIRIPLSAIADLLAPLFDHLVGSSERCRRGCRGRGCRKSDAFEQHLNEIGPIAGCLPLDAG